MKEFAKIALFYVSPFKKYAFLNIMFNILGAFFSVFSLALVGPFLGILFNTSEKVHQLMVFKFSKEVIFNNLNYYMTNYVESHGAASVLTVLCVLVLIAFFLKTASMYLANYFIIPLRTGVERNLRNSMYQKILSLPLSYFSDTRKGDVMARMVNDVTEIQVSILSSLVMLFRDPINIIVTLVALVIISPSLTLFVLILLPLSGFVIGRVGKNLRKTGLEV